MSTLPIILIVDDDSSHRAMLRTVLRGWGYATDEADDGDTAVEKVKERAYDAVLSDVRMARMDGISAIREILHHNPSIPVLVMTAWQSVETAVAALRLGAYDYLEKPLDFDLLHLTLERALDHTRLAAENRELREYIRESPSGLLGRSPRMRDGEYGRAHRGDRPDYRGVGDRQGAGRPRHSGGQCPERQGVRHRQLCGPQ